MKRHGSTGIRIHILSIGAASLVVLGLAGLAPSASRPELVLEARPSEPQPPLRPSYVVRAAPPPVRQAEPMPVKISLAPPLATAAEPEAETELWYVTAGALNLRSAPSGSSQQLAALPRGTAVEVTGNEGNWMEVSTSDGLEGWVFGKYLAREAE